IKQYSKKWQVCKGLQSEQISLYIKHTPAQFGGSRHIEIIARELFPKFHNTKFSRKSLNDKKKRKLNRTLYAESIWQIDRASDLICSKICTGYTECSNICKKCCYIRSDKRLCTNIAKKIPLSENI
ncbi:25698_t:CDS:2, partial [Racocetra persica]